MRNPNLRRYWSMIGGLIGGRRRAKLLSAERRREIGRIAAQARWARAKKKTEE